MPLHLLGKKSWNVYNTKNIERVRRDEAAAEAAEEAEEQRMQEVDAERRLAILRGEVPPPLPEPAETEESHTGVEPSKHDRSSYPGSSSRRKRKRPGEDDTDFELRLANERNHAHGTELEVARKPASSAPIVDHAGHIDLFGEDPHKGRGQKNEEAEREAKKKKQEYEDQYTMRFANAGGKSGLDKPWYFQSEEDAGARPSKDVWGNDDPRRKDRDAKRIVSSDPLAMMKKGASKVRELKAERKKYKEDQQEDMRQMRKEERQRERREERRERHTRHDEDRDRGKSSRREDHRDRGSSSHRDADRDRRISQRSEDRARSRHDRSRSPRRERHHERHR